MPGRPADAWQTMARVCGSASGAATARASSMALAASRRGIETLRMPANVDEAASGVTAMAILSPVPARRPARYARVSLLCSSNLSASSMSTRISSRLPARSRRSRSSAAARVPLTLSSASWNRPMNSATRGSPIALSTIEIPASCRSRSDGWGATHAHRIGAWVRTASSSVERPAPGSPTMRVAECGTPTLVSNSVRASLRPTIGRSVPA